MGSNRVAKTPKGLRPYGRNPFGVFATLLLPIAQKFLFLPTTIHHNSTFPGATLFQERMEAIPKLQKRLMSLTVATKLTEKYAETVEDTWEAYISQGKKIAHHL
jgi:hypothetical protein